MEYFDFEDCGPKLKRVLLERFENEEIAALEVRQRIELHPSLAGTGSRQRVLEESARTLIIAAVISQPERGRALLARVGDALINERVSQDDALLIPVVLSQWLVHIAKLSPDF